MISSTSFCGSETQESCLCSLWWHLTRHGHHTGCLDNIRDNPAAQFSKTEIKFESVIFKWWQTVTLYVCERMQPFSRWPLSTSLSSCLQHKLLTVQGPWACSKAGSYSQTCDWLASTPPSLEVHTGASAPADFRWQIKAVLLQRIWKQGFLHRREGLSRLQTPPARIHSNAQYFKQQLYRSRERSKTDAKVWSSCLFWFFQPVH